MVGYNHVYHTRVKFNQNRINRRHKKTNWNWHSTLKTQINTMIFVSITSSHIKITGCVFSYKLWYIVGFRLVEILTNLMPTIYRNLFKNTGTDNVKLMTLKNEAKHLIICSSSDLIIFKKNRGNNTIILQRKKIFKGLKVFTWYIYLFVQ